MLPNIHCRLHQKMGDRYIGKPIKSRAYVFWKLCWQTLTKMLCPLQLASVWGFRQSMLRPFGLGQILLACMCRLRFTSRCLPPSQAVFRSHPQVLCGNVTDPSVTGDHFLLRPLTESHDKRRAMGSLSFIFGAFTFIRVCFIGNLVASTSKLSHFIFKS